jgi:phage tail sheath protein FI
MPEYLAPGIYIEEIERGPKPIEGVETSTAASSAPASTCPTR